MVLLKSPLLKNVVTIYVWVKNLLFWYFTHHKIKYLKKCIYFLRIL